MFVILKPYKRLLQSRKAQYYSVKAQVKGIGNRIKCKNNDENKSGQE
jgi:hypothetical protein